MAAANKVTAYPSTHHCGSHGNCPGPGMGRETLDKQITLLNWLNLAIQGFPGAGLRHRNNGILKYKNYSQPSKIEDWLRFFIL